MRAARGLAAGADVTLVRVILRLPAGSQVGVATSCEFVASQASCKDLPKCASANRTVSKNYTAQPPHQQTPSRASSKLRAFDGPDLALAGTGIAVRPATEMVCSHEECALRSSCEAAL